MSEYKSVQPKNGFEIMCSGSEGPVSHEERGVWVYVSIIYLLWALCLLDLMFYFFLNHRFKSVLVVYT